MELLLNILTIVAFILSSYTFVTDLIANRKKIDLEILRVFMWGSLYHKRYVFHIMICNKSRLPIAITGIAISQNGFHSSFVSTSEKIHSATRKENGVIKERNEHYSTPFPLSLQGFEAKAALFIIDSHLKDFCLLPKESISFQISTSRGILFKSLSFDAFTDYKSPLKYALKVE